MSGADTSLGDGGRRFESTAWSMVLSFREGESEDRQQALERLVQRYWKPIYYFIRLEWNKSNEDSKDLAQQFFSQLIESDWLGLADQDRGSFRGFLKTSVRNFLRQDHRSGRALKRGGQQPIVSLDKLKAAEHLLPSAAQDPSAAMDQEWRRVQIAEALKRLGVEYAAADKSVYYQVFLKYHFGSGDESSHVDVARECNVSKDSVNNYLRDARPRFKRVLRNVVAESVTNLEELEEEFQQLFGQSFDG